MSIGLFKQEKKQNYWVRGNKIPLGANVYDNSPVFKIMPKKSDTLLISALPERGKSVIFRLYWWFLCQVRPGLMFDWEGEDHKYSYFANSQPINLPPYTRAQKVRRSLFFKYPADFVVGDSEDIRNSKWNFEQMITPNLDNYTADELRGMGFPKGGSMDLKRVLKKYGPFKDLEELYDFIRHFPTNERKSNSMYKDADLSKKHYERGDIIPSQTKPSLLRYMFHILERDMFCVDKKGTPKIVELLLNDGYNVFLNFNGNVDLARVEIARLINAITTQRKKYPDTYVPVIGYEEFDKIAPRSVDDQAERSRIQYVKTQTVESYRRARKQGLAQCGCSPSISKLDKSIVDLTVEKIFGQVSGYDLAEAKRCTNEYAFDRIKRLKFNRYTGMREFCFFNEFRNVFVFRPYACPQEMHRESTAKRIGG